MEKIGFWKSLTISFQPRAYRKIVSQTFGRSFGYLALFLLLASAVLSIKYTLILREGMEKANEWINTNLPGKISETLPEKIRVENGVVSTSAEEPFVRRWSFGEGGKQEEFAFIIDTTGQIPNLDDYQYGFLLTRDKLIFKNTKPRGAVEIQEQDLSEVKSFTLRRGDEEKGEFAVFTWEERAFPLTYENIERWRRTTSRLLPLMIVPLFIHYLVAKLVQLFLFSLASLIINELTKARLEYRNLLNIGIFALVPPIVLALLVKLAGESIPYFFLLYILLYLTFLFMGIKGSKIATAEQVPERKM